MLVARFPTLTSSFTSSRTSGPAPLAVRFNAKASSGGRSGDGFLDLYHSWNFGDTGAGNHTYGPILSKNVARGPIQAHVFETPGVYTVTHTVTDEAFATHSTTDTITVHDPEDFYTSGGTFDGETLCLSKSNNFTGAPAAGNGITHSNNAAYTYADVITAINAATKPLRVLLCSSDVWDSVATPQPTAWTKDDIFLGPYGGGVAQINVTNDAVNNYIIRPKSRSVVSDIEFIDPGPGTNHYRAIGFQDLSDHVLALRLESTDSATRMSSFTSAGGTVSCSNIFFSDCEFSGFAELVGGAGDAYGMFVDGISGLCFLNTRMHDVVTNTGGDGQHILRLSQTDNSVISNCRLSKAGNGQQCLTIRSIVSPGSQYINVTDNEILCEGAGNSGWGADNILYPIHHIVFQYNLYDLGTNNAANSLNPFTSDGIRIVGNIIIATGHGTAQITGITFSHPTAGDDATHKFGKISVHNNTYYYPLTANSACFAMSVSTGLPMEEQVRANANLMYSPGGNGSTKMFSTTVSVIQANNSSDSEVKNTDPVFENGSGTLTVATDFRLTSGSPSGAKTGGGSTPSTVWKVYLPPYDYFGNPYAVTNRSRGAIQYS
jgi:hypothetical protein